MRSPKRTAVRSLRLEPLENRQLLAVGGAIYEPAADLGCSSFDGVSVCQSEIRTDHDVIPRFGANPTIVAVASGAWSDPATWSRDRIPQAGDRVSIPDGLSLRYDVDSNAKLDVVEVSGELRFATSQETSLWLNELMVLPTGVLTVGTQTQPIEAGVESEIVITDTPGPNGRHFKTDQMDPQQFGNGVIVFGRFDMHGEEKTAYARATDDLSSGVDEIVLADVPSEWSIGDEIVIPRTSQSPFVKNLASEQSTEVRELSRLDTNRISFERPLSGEHSGVAENPFELERFPHIGNLTRNAVIRSENSDGVRGHFLATSAASVSIANARFLAIGRTTGDRIDSFDGVQPGLNQIGRYGLHAHHLAGDLSVTGSVFQDARRWGIAIHDSNDAIVHNNIVFDTDGAAIVTEKGNEQGLSLIGNLVIKVDGGFDGGERGGASDPNDLAADGSAYWFRAPVGTIEGNFAYDAAGYGYNFNGYNKTREQSGGILRQFETFRNNEVASSRGGLWLTWSQGQFDIDSYERQVFEGLFVWHVQQDGVHSYHEANNTFRDITVIADPRVSNMNEGSHWHFEHQHTIGLQFGNPSYENHNVRIEGARISGVNVGVVAPTHAGTDGFHVSDLAVEAYVNIALDRNADPSSITHRDTRFLPSRTVRVSESLPSSVADIWHEGNGVIREGVASSNPAESLPAPLPANLKLRNSILQIDGGSGDDTALVRQDSGFVVVDVNDAETSFASEAVSSILFFGGAGNDQFRNLTAIPVTARGGDGDDLIVGGDGNDVLYGDAGNDDLYGGGGDDKIRGGDGDDRIDAGAGNDPVVLGGAGDDQMTGGIGNDVLLGGQGHDMIFGDLGDDRIKGESGNDLLLGGAGDDILWGGPGDDLLDGMEGNDRLNDDEPSDAQAMASFLAGVDPANDSRQFFAWLESLTSGHS